MILFACFLIVILISLGIKYLFSYKYYVKVEELEVRFRTKREADIFVCKMTKITKLLNEIYREEKDEISKETC